MSAMWSLENALLYVEKWMSGKGLQMNPEMIVFIVFGSRPQLEKLSLGKIEGESSIIKNSNTIKLLGVYLNKKLSFQTHIM